jgi:hypothetical protein
MFIPIGKIDPG